MEDIFNLAKDGNALKIKIWLEKFDNNPNQ